MRYGLRTLLIVLALGPAVLAVAWWASTVEDADKVIFPVIITVVAVWIGARMVHHCTREW